jgi:hypothetical protein
MPSSALNLWQTDRMPRLAQVDVQCAAVFALVPPNPQLAEEILRGYVVLLSAHFQGFCRDLYVECAQIVVSKVRPSLRFLFENQFVQKLKLDHGNPNIDNIAEDFNRFGFDLMATARAEPAFAVYRQHLVELNKWRNTVAHHGPSPAGFPGLTLASVAGWRLSCDGLATTLTEIMYNQLRHLLRRAPW